MNQAETNRFNQLYKRHLRLLKLQGKSQKTIDAYARAVRRISEYFDRCPDKLSLKQREKYFSQLVESHSWSTVLATYSMGLRLSETLALQVGDIDGNRKQVHVRRGKGHKDRFVPLPDLTYHALRALWCKHRNPCWLFPNPVGSLERIRNATTHMARGGAQAALKAVVDQCGIKKKPPFTPYATVLPPICLNRA